MQQYKDHIQRILNEGTFTPGRSGNLEAASKPISEWEPDASLSVFGAQLRFDLSEGLPFVTGKSLPLKTMVKELTWMLRGESNTKTLGCKIWDRWALDHDVVTRRSIPEGLLVQIIVDKGYATTLEEAAAFVFNIYKKHIKWLGEGEAPDLANFAQMIELGEENFTTDFAKVNQELEELDIRLYEDIPRFKEGYCGPIYGEQWRRFTGAVVDPRNPDGNKKLVQIDQFMNAYDNLSNPKTRYTRKNYITAWNPAVTPVLSAGIKENIAAGNQGLSPCHNGLHLVVKPKIENGQHVGDVLNTSLHLLSSDTGLGLPFNISGYSLIHGIFACEFGLGDGTLSTNIDDAHIYANQVDGLKDVYLQRPTHKLPTLDREAYEPMFQDVVIRVYETTKKERGQDVTNVMFDKAIADAKESVPGQRRVLFEMFLNHVQADDILKLVKGYEFEPPIQFDLNK